MRTNCNFLVTSLERKLFGEVSANLAKNRIGTEAWHNYEYRCLVPQCCILYRLLVV